MVCLPTARCLGEVLRLGAGRCGPPPLDLQALTSGPAWPLPLALPSSSFPRNSLASGIPITSSEGPPPHLLSTESKEEKGQGHPSIHWSLGQSQRRPTVDIMASGGSKMRTLPLGTISSHPEAGGSAQRPPSQASLPPHPRKSSPLVSAVPRAILQLPPGRWGHGSWSQAGARSNT